MGEFFIQPDQLERAIGRFDAPLIFDVRRPAAYDASDRVLPAARWRDPVSVEDWASNLPGDADIVVYCVHGHQVSQSVAAQLRSMGYSAQALAGGIDAWIDAQRISILKQGLPSREDTRPSRWITRIRPKVDRVACPWFIHRFVDPAAEIFFVASDHVKQSAVELDAIPFDIEGVEFTHVGDRCSFDAFLDRFGVEDRALREVAMVVRGADTGRPDLVPEAAGLLAMSLGLSALSDEDDRGQIDRGMLFYDSLYAWRKAATDEKHGGPAR